VGYEDDVSGRLSGCNLIQNEHHSSDRRRLIDRGYYTVARRYEFYVRVARAISHD